MTPTETVTLGKYIRALFPQQPMDEFTEDLLDEVLRPYRDADCKEALRNIAARGDRWCAPTDITAEVKRIREGRIAAVGDLTPPPGLTDAEERDWLRDTRRLIGDGEAVDTTRPGLKQRNMRALLAQAVRSLPAVPRGTTGQDINHLPRAS